jgi:ComF family protein
VRGRALAAQFLDFFLPAVCLGCGDHLTLECSGELVCGPCRTRLRAAPRPCCTRCGFPLGSGAPAAKTCYECGGWRSELSAANFAVVLRPPATALVHGLKYDGWSGLAGLMGERMARSAIPRELESGTYLIVPMPTTRRRARARGYNQARLLAEAVAELVHMPLIDGLERGERGSTQVGLHPAERRANVKHAFSVRGDARAALEGARVLLVDDVLTTGSTAMEAARPLVQAGAKQVFLSTFARALPYAD